MAVFSTDTTNSGVDNGLMWQELYPRLRLIIRRQVYAFRLSAWSGQEEEIVEDILQETARRIIERTRKAEAGDAVPIFLLENMAVVTACNYCRDLRRRDQRIVHLVAQPTLPVEESALLNRDQSYTMDEVTEQIYQEELFTQLAREIASFPYKQRTALLVDLANRMSFVDTPTPLQKAFLKVGIFLKEYKKPLPESQKERNKHTALVYYAYKRVAQLAQLQEYTQVA